MHTKAFKLFISSTFDDFRLERDVLHSKIFPQIFALCESQGFVFQPVDLRWGVTEEAQNDQRTLEICLAEVERCKSFPAPNFLILTGDRYGWIPLPYTIEKTEFDAIIGAVDLDEDRCFLRSWYSLDENQLPASYILRKREGVYQSYEQWSEVEADLHDVILSALPYAGLSATAESKFFTSATEREFAHYINVLSEEEQAKLFCFDREIVGGDESSPKYFNDPFGRLEPFRDKVQSVVLAENLLAAQTTLSNEDSLDVSYLSDFEQRVSSYLKTSIQEQINEFSDSQFEAHEKEVEEFREAASANFVGRVEELQKLSEYLHSDTNDRPLVIAGPSGSGKSALVAKAIKQARSSGINNIIYHPCGVAEISSKLTELLTTTLLQLGLSVDVLREYNAFTDLDAAIQIAEHVLEAFAGQVVLIIDGLEYFENIPNEFSFDIPHQLQGAFKIIVTLRIDDLTDEEKEFSRFGQLLRSPNLIDLGPQAVNEKLQLFTELLRAYGRTVTSDQMEYVRSYLDQDGVLPVHIRFISEMARFWASSESNPSLPKLENLASGYRVFLIENNHHNKRLVERALSILWASVNGIGEGDMIKLLSQDQQLIAEVGNDDYHKNLSGHLPVAVLVRLIEQIRFLLTNTYRGNKVYLKFANPLVEEIIDDVYSSEIVADLLKTIEDKFILGRSDVLFHSAAAGHEHGILSIRLRDRQFNNSSWGAIQVAAMVQQTLEFPETTIEERLEFIKQMSQEKTWLEGYFARLREVRNDHFWHFDEDSYSRIDAISVALARTWFDHASNEKAAYHAYMRSLDAAMNVDIQNRQLLFAEPESDWSKKKIEQVKIYLDEAFALVQRGENQWDDPAMGEHRRALEEWRAKVLALQSHSNGAHGGSNTTTQQRDKFDIDPTAFDSPLREAFSAMNQVESEFEQRYQFGDEEYFCWNLFVGIKRQIAERLIAKYSEGCGISGDQVLAIVGEFMEYWPNTETCCADTDGMMHINEILLALNRIFPN